MVSGVPIIAGNQSDKSVARDITFRNLDPLTDGGLMPVKPDVFYGACPGKLNRGVRGDLAKLIIPSTQEDAPILPNFFLEAKGPDGSAAVMKRQACYKGALDARSIHSLRSFCGQEKYDNNAYSITSTYQDGQLKLYATHPVQSKDPHRSTGYIMTQLNSYALSGNSKSFREGVAAYRNGRDWAKEQRDNLLELANDKAGDVSFSETQRSSETMVRELPNSDASADELALDVDAGRYMRKRVRRSERSLSPHSHPG